jgi:hypothetical protein
MSANRKTVLGKFFQKAGDVAKAVAIAPIVKAATGKDLKYSTNFGASLGKPIGNIAGFAFRAGAGVLTGGLSELGFAASRSFFAQKQPSVEGMPPEPVTNDEVRPIVQSFFVERYGYSPDSAFLESETASFIDHFSKGKDPMPIFAAHWDNPENWIKIGKTPPAILLSGNGTNSTGKSNTLLIAGGIGGVLLIAVIVILILRK